MRLRAAEALGWSHVPVVYEDLPEREEWLRLLRDNREYGEDDDQAVAEMLYALQEADADLALSGFDEKDINALLDSVSGDSAGEDTADLEPPAEPTTKPGDLWLLGEHRLLCGDSTVLTDVERLMAGRKAHLVYTDPPYGVDYDGGTLERERLVGDADATIYGAVLPMILVASDDRAPLYLWHADQSGMPVLDALNAAGYECRSQLIWNKNLAQFGSLSAQYKRKHEPCWYAHRKGCVPYWYGPTNEVTVWDVDRARANEYHPTQKPVALAERAIKNSSRRGDLVLDLFGGSGSTLVAADGLDRVAYLMEIDPRYCDVIIRRWETLTGKTATLAPHEGT